MDERKNTIKIKSYGTVIEHMFWQQKVLAAVPVYPASAKKDSIVSDAAYQCIEMLPTNVDNTEYV